MRSKVQATSYAFSSITSSFFGFRDVFCSHSLDLYNDSAPMSYGTARCYICRSLTTLTLCVGQPAFLL